MRKNIFFVVVRGETYCVRAVDGGAVNNILTQMSIPFTDIQSASPAQRKAAGITKIYDLHNLRLRLT